MEAKVPPGLSQRRRPAFDFHVRRVDLAEDLPSAAHPGLRQTIHADLPGPPEETRIRESTNPSPWRPFSVRGTWLRRSRAPSAIPAWVPSRPGSRTFQKPWRWSRTRSAAVSSTSFRCGPVYLSLQPVILTLSRRGNYREHFIYRRLGCKSNSLLPTGRPLDESRLARG